MGGGKGKGTKKKYEDIISPFRTDKQAWTPKDHEAMKAVIELKAVREKAYQLSKANDQGQEAEAARLEAKTKQLVLQLERAFPNHGLVMVIEGAYECNVLPASYKKGVNKGVAPQVLVRMREHYQLAQDVNIWLKKKYSSACYIHLIDMALSGGGYPWANAYSQMKDLVPSSLTWSSEMKAVLDECYPLFVASGHGSTSAIELKQDILEKLPGIEWPSVQYMARKRGLCQSYAGRGTRGSVFTAEVIKAVDAFLDDHSDQSTIVELAAQESTRKALERITGQPWPKISRWLYASGRRPAMVPRYSEEEISTMLELHSEGCTHADIQRELVLQYGVARTSAAVEDAIRSHKQKAGLSDEDTHKRTLLTMGATRSRQEVAARIKCPAGAVANALLRLRRQAPLTAAAHACAARLGGTSEALSQQAAAASAQLYSWVRLSYPALPPDAASVKDPDALINDLDERAPSLLLQQLSLRRSDAGRRLQHVSFAQEDPQLMSAVLLQHSDKLSANSSVCDFGQAAKAVLRMVLPNIHCNDVQYVIAAIKALPPSLGRTDEQRRPFAELGDACAVLLDAKGFTEAIPIGPDLDDFFEYVATLGAAYTYVLGYLTECGGFVPLYSGEGVNSIYAGTKYSRLETYVVEHDLGYVRPLDDSPGKWALFTGCCMAGLQMAVRAVPLTNRQAALEMERLLHDSLNFAANTSHNLRVRQFWVLQGNPVTPVLLHELLDKMYTQEVAPGGPLPASTTGAMQSTPAAPAHGSTAAPGAIASNDVTGPSTSKPAALGPSATTRAAPALAGSKRKPTASDNQSKIDWFFKKRG